MNWTKPCCQLVMTLKEVKVVRGGKREDPVRRMPSGVEDLAVEVETVDADLVLLALAAGTNAAWPQRLAWLKVFTVRLEGHIAPRLTVKDAEEVVVGAGDDISATVARK